MNNTQEKISLLQIAFKGLEPHELQEMAEVTQFRTYPPGYILCHEGAYEDSFYIVAEGSVVVSKKMLDEVGQHILRVGGRGDLVGEMGLIQNAPRAATVKTLTECTLLEMEKKDCAFARIPGGYSQHLWRRFLDPKSSVSPGDQCDQIYARWGKCPGSHFTLPAR